MKNQSEDLEISRRILHYILDHIKPSLQKAPEQIILHARTNGSFNDNNYLKNVKKTVKLVKETCKDTKLRFFSEISRRIFN